MEVMYIRMLFIAKDYYVFQIHCHLEAVVYRFLRVQAFPISYTSYTKASSTLRIIIIRALVHNSTKDSICVKQVLFCYLWLRTSIGNDTTIEFTHTIVEVSCTHDFHNGRFTEIKDFQSRIKFLILHQHICKD